MILLALDSSERSQGLALVHGDQLLAERQSPQPSSHAEELLTHLQELLAEAALRFDQVDALALTVGPGSFTGLRIAVSTVKGLALQRNLPIIPVGTLLALAAPYAADFPWVAPCLDARMGQVYGAVYSSSVSAGPIQELQAPEARGFKEFQLDINTLDNKGIVIGSGLRTYPELGQGIKSDPSATVQAPWVARLAGAMYQRGQFLTGKELEPAYLRLSTPELRLLERNQNSAKKAPKKMV